MKTNIFLFIALSLVFTSSAFPQTYVYDQSFQDPSFLEFKVKLIEAVLEKNTKKLFPLLADNVHLSDDKCRYASKTCFMEEFKDGAVEQQEMWDQMLKVISYGFSTYKVKENIYRLVDKGDVVFQAPSYLNTFDDNGGSYILVLGRHVNIRERPTLKSEVVAQASLEKLRYNNPMLSNSKTAYSIVNGKQWYEIILPGGKVGYIIEDYVSARINKELSIKKINGQWKIISFYSPPNQC